jgi:hypothetical protein
VPGAGNVINGLKDSQIGVFGNSLRCFSSNLPGHNDSLGFNQGDSLVARTRETALN